MELRTLRWFLAIAQEESMTRAAKRLHVTQPTLSKQIKALETELGTELFERHSSGLRLTAAGKLLRERAQDLVSIADRIEDEFVAQEDVTGGELYFGLAESYQLHHLATQIKLLQDQCPNLHYHVSSGVTEQVLDRLDDGVIDFAVLAERFADVRYESLRFPEQDRWGVIMPAGCDLAEQKTVQFEDLVGLPLLCSDQGWRRDISRWCGRRQSKLRLAGTFGLSYNGSVFAREGLGYLLTFDRIVDVGPGSGLVFRPLDPPLETPLYLVWRRNHALSPIAERFLAQVTQAFGENAATR